MLQTQTTAQLGLAHHRRIEIPRSQLSQAVRYPTGYQDVSIFGLIWGKEGRGRDRGELLFTLTRVHGVIYYYALRLRGQKKNWWGTRQNCEGPDLTPEPKTSGSPSTNFRLKDSQSQYLLAIYC